MSKTTKKPSMDEQTQDSGESRETHEVLTDSQKLHINEYVGNLIRFWAKFIGIANLAAIVIGLLYIAFIVPKNAVNEVRGMIGDKLEETIVELALTKQQLADINKNVKDSQDQLELAKQQLADNVKDSQDQFNLTRQQLADINKNVNGSKDQYEKLKIDIDTLSQEKNIALVANVVKILQDAPQDVSDFVKKLAGLESELSGMRLIGKIVIPVSYDGSPTEWTSINGEAAFGLNWEQYNDFLVPNQKMQTRLCWSYTDSGSNDDSIDIRIRRFPDDGVTDLPVLYEAHFSTTWSGAALFHYDCGDWKLTETISCKYSFSETCNVEIKSTSPKVIVRHLEMEVAVK